MAPAVEVSALDSRGQLNQTFAQGVTLCLEDAMGVVIDSVRVIARGGIAVFNSFAVALPGTGYRLSAVVPGYQPGISTRFSVTPAGAVVDQQQVLMDSSATVLTVGGSGSQTVAQVVTAGIAGALVAARLPVSCNGDLTVEIRGVTNGVPSDSVLTAETYAPNSVSFHEGLSTFHGLVLQAPVSFAAGDRFAIVVRSSLACDVAGGPEGDSYPGGEAFLRGLNATDTWQPLGVRADLPFQTLVK